MRFLVVAVVLSSVAEAEPLESGKPLGTASGQPPRLAPLGSPIKVLTDLKALTTGGEFIDHRDFDPVHQTVRIVRTWLGEHRPSVVAGVVDLRTGTLSAAGDESPITSEVSSPDGAFTVKQDGDHLELFNRQGRHLRRLAPGHPASYRAAFAPDGKRVLFESYQSDHNYHLVEEKVAGGLRELRDLPGLVSPAVFSPDGRWAYLHTLDVHSPVENQDKRECLVRVNGATLRDPAMLVCHETDVANVSLSFAPSRSHAVFVASNERSTQLTRLRLPDGATGAQLTLPLRFGSIAAIFHDGERVVLTRGGGDILVIVDLPNQRQISLGEDHSNALESTGYSIWGIAGERVIAARLRYRRTSPTTFERVEEHLVSLDVDALLGQP